MPLQAEVAVSDATIYYDKLYSYAVPARLHGRVFIGIMVFSPLVCGRARSRICVVLWLKLL